MQTIHTAENTDASAVKVTRKTYSKQLHTFTEDGEPMHTIVYGGLVHLNDAYGNIIIEDLGEGKYEGGRYMLIIGAESWVSDNLAELEAILFPWMESEGYDYDEEVK